METSIAAAAAFMEEQVSGDTLTDWTQPNSRAFNFIAAIWLTAPTLPPGLAGVDFGEPTVPKRNEEIVMTISS
jgi:hypothetical protein